MPSFLEPLLDAPPDRFVLVNRRNGRVVASRLETAFDSASRRKGLLHRSTMPEGGALFIAPCSGVHTFFMQFPIDIVFTARDGRVVKVCRAVRPWRLALAWSAFATIELASGASAASDTQKDDRLSVDIKLRQR